MTDRERPGRAEREDVAAEELLPERERTVFERSAHPMFLVTDDRRFAGANAAGLRLLGLTREELIGRGLEEVTSEEGRAAVSEGWADFAAGRGALGGWEVVRPDGSRIAVSYSAMPHIVPGINLGVLVPSAEADEPAADPARAGSSPLTKREKELLRLIALGATSEEAAERMGVSPETARTHARNALEKLGARTRAQAIAVAMKRGLIDVDEGRAVRG